MVQRLEVAFNQALRIVSSSPAAQFILAAALIYMSMCVLGKAKKSIL